MRRPERSSTNQQRRPLVAAVCSLLLGSGCYSTGEGLDPPANRIYFPVGLALANDARHLVVLNSDFDLQYNAGTLQVLDLERARATMPQPCADDTVCGEGRACDASFGLCVEVSGPSAGSPCGAVSVRTRSDQLLYPGLCESIDPARPPSGSSWITETVQIGAFATDVIYRKRPSTNVDPGAPGRIFFPVRGDATLHWADVLEDGTVDCGQRGNGGACDDRHRAGDDPDRENTRDLRLEAEPFALDATSDGRAIAVTHQTTQTVSVFDDQSWSSTGPRLVDELSQLGDRPVGVAAVPVPAVVRARGDAYAPGFLVTFRAESYVSLVRYASGLDGSGASPPDWPVLANAGSSSILVNSVGTDSRGIAVDESARLGAEAECYAQTGVEPACANDSACVAALDAGLRDRLVACLQEAAANGLGVYVASRSPDSLLVGRTTPAENVASSTDLPAFAQTIRLSFGPSRIAVGNVIVGGTRESPLLEQRVFTVCFDSRRVVVYDPARRAVEVEIPTGRGPHAIAIDEQHGLLFIGHFTDSYIGVVSLDRRFPKSYGTFISTIGKPSPPRASK